MHVPPQDTDSDLVLAAPLDDAERLIRENERLRGLLAPLVADGRQWDDAWMEVDFDEVCRYCQTRNGVHAPDCAWEQARRAVEEGERHEPTV